MFPYTYLAVFAGVWLFAIVASAVAIRWSLPSPPRWFPASIILSILAIIISFLGLTRFHFSSMSDTNGHVNWRFDSRWLFTASLILGIFAFLCASWRKYKSIRAFHND